MFFKNIKAKTLWIITIVLFLISIGLVIGVIYSKGAMTTVLIVAISISFLALTFSIQAASFKSFNLKPKKRNCEEALYLQSYDNLAGLLTKNKFKLRIKSYGDSYLFIQNKVAYKVTLVKDIDNYFNVEASSEDDTDLEIKRRLDNCKRFIGLEIFKDVNEEYIEKIKDFTLKGSRVYYTALVNVNNNKLKCYNYQEPDDAFYDDYMELLKKLEINRCSDDFKLDN